MKKRKVIYLISIFAFIVSAFSINYKENESSDEIVDFTEQEYEQFMQVNDDSDLDGDYSDTDLDISFLEQKAVNSKYNIQFVSSGHNESEFHPFRWGSFGYFIIDNQIVFCIDPLTTFTNQAVEVSPNSSTWGSMSPTLQRDTSIMASLGIKNYERTNNKEFLYATQLLIWELSDSRYNLDGGTNLQEEIDYLREEFKAYFKIPSFSSTSKGSKKHTLKYNKSTSKYEILLTDTNKVLDKKYSYIFNTTNGDFKFSDGAGANTLLITTTNPKATLTDYNLKYKGISHSSKVRIFSSPQFLYTGPTVDVNSYFSLDVKPATGSLKVEKDFTNYTSFPSNFNCSNFEVIVNPGNVKKTLSADGDGCSATFTDLMPGNYTVKEVNNSTNYVIDVGEDSATVESNKVVIANIVNELAFGNIELNKKGNSNLIYPLETDINLQGVEYTLYDHSNVEVEKLVTDKNGNAKSKNLILGTYYLRETKAREGYKIDDTTYEIKITSHGQKVSKKFKNNAIVGRAELFKVGEVLDNDSDEIKSLSGAEFTVYQNNKVVKTVISDQNGYVNTGNLVYGDYKICETKPPYGYKPSNYCESFSIRTNNEVIKLGGDLNNQVVNYPIYGKINIFKQGEDIETNNIINLKDAEFSVKDLDNNVVVDTMITDKNGFASSSNLKAGRYNVLETKAPPGYVNNGYSENVEIKTDGQVIILNNNKPVINHVIKSIFTLKKSGEALENSNVEQVDLEGVEFKLYRDINNNRKYDKNDSHIQTYLTDENGEIKSEPLNYGNYVLIETSTLEGYYLDDLEFAFSVVNNGEIIELNGGSNVINEVIRGDIEIEKLGVSKEETINLSGVEFEIYQDFDSNQIIDETDILIDTVITDEQGFTKYEGLKYGDYILKESVTNEGYILNDESIPFRIDSREQKLQYEIKNTKIENNFKIKKHDQYDTMIQNVEFTIYKNNPEGKLKLSVDGEIQTVDEIKTIKTDKNGIAASPMLEMGTYYIKETMAPENYVMSTKVEEFVVKEENMKEEFEYEFKNELIENIIEIDKRDKETNELLSEAEIKVYDDKKNIVDQFISGQTTHKVKLKYGNYTICESKAPQGYKIDKKCQDITVSEDDLTQHVNIYNNKIKENIIVATGIKLIILPFIVLVLSFAILYYVRH